MHEHEGINGASPHDRHFKNWKERAHYISGTLAAQFSVLAVYLRIKIERLTLVSETYCLFSLKTVIPLPRAIYLVEIIG